MAKPTTSGKAKSAAHRIEPSHKERIESLEHRVTAIEATLNGRLSRIDEKLDNIGVGVRTANDCNSHIVRSLRELRDEHHMQQDRALERAAEAGERWKGGRDK